MRKSVVIIITSIVVVLVLSLSAVWYLRPQLLSAPFSKFGVQIPMVTIEGADPAYQFTQNKNFSRAAEFAETISNLTEESTSLKIIVTSDEKAAEVPFIKGEEIVSGFSFPNKKDISIITVYVTPEIQSDQGAFQYEITRNYLLALLYASEYKKVLADPTYTPEYRTKQQLIHQITMDAVDQQKFPLMISKK
jgi:hypothetical protein